MTSNNRRILIYLVAIIPVVQSSGTTLIRTGREKGWNMQIGTNTILNNGWVTGHYGPRLELHIGMPTVTMALILGSRKLRITETNS